MTIPEGIAAGLQARAVGLLILAEFDSTEGTHRLVLGEDGYFDDTSGNRWLGSKLLGMSEIEGNINGKAPAVQFGISYTVDPTSTDLVDIIKSFGVDAVNGRSAKVWFQYFGNFEERIAPIYDPILLSSLTMRKLGYNIEGDTGRGVSLSCEGPYPMRSRPVNGRYTDGDQRRRASGDPSFEFIPTNGWDDQALFDS